MQNLRGTARTSFQPRKSFLTERWQMRTPIEDRRHFFLALLRSFPIGGSGARERLEHDLVTVRIAASSLDQT